MLPWAVGCVRMYRNLKKARRTSKTGMKTLSCRNTCMREAPSKPLPPTRRAQESDSTTLLLVLSDEAEVGRDSAEAQIALDFVAWKREVEGKAPEGKGKVLTRVWDFEPACLGSMNSRTPRPRPRIKSQSTKSYSFEKFTIHPEIQ
jgi:hypothetical protein